MTIDARLAVLSEDFRRAQEGASKGKDALLRAERTLAAVTAGRKVVQEAAALTQQRAHARVACVVQRCLSAIFDSPYEFNLAFEEKRGRTEAALIFTRGEVEIEDAADQAGGGVVDVASFALRLACLMSHLPSCRKLLVLDEPFRHLSEEYVPAARELLEVLAREMGVQLVIVTHNRELACGKVIEL